MAYSDLRDFIDALEKKKELKRISLEVDPFLEITEFADRSVKNGGPALLFEKPKGSRIPVLINSFASMRRMELALEVDSVESVAQRIYEFLEMRMPEGLIGKLKMLPKLAEVGAFFPKMVSNGPCKDVIRRDNFSLDEFPILHCWPQDGGRFITLPMVFSRNPDTGKRNCGCYRMQVYDERTTGMHWQTHKHGAEHYRRLLKEGKNGAHGRRGGNRCGPGHDVLGDFAAAARSGRNDDGRISARQAGGNGEVRDVGSGGAGQRRDRAGRLRRDSARMRTEGPFGDHTGFYSLEDEYPVFHVTCVTQRKHPIYATTIVGPPPMEDFYMGKAIERIFLPLMRLQLPEIRDISMPAEGVFHNLILVSIRKSYPLHARKVMHAIWGLGQAMFSKCIVVVDEDVDVQDVSEVAWKALNNIDPERDIQFVLGPVDSLDHSSRLPNYGSKMGIDATRKWKEEGFVRPWPDVIRMPDEVKQRVNQLWKKAGLG